jgi:hypothetical protein
VTPETNLNRDTRVPLVSATPWGKGTGNPKMDSDGNILTKKSMSLDKKKVKKTVQKRFFSLLYIIPVIKINIFQIINKQSHYA